MPEETTPILYDYLTGEILRKATPEEVEASAEAGETGVIEVEGRSCFVIE